MKGKVTEDNPFPDNCGSCHYWDDGECHRRINAIATSYNKQWPYRATVKLWVKTKHHDWCGEYKKYIQVMVDIDESD